MRFADCRLALLLTVFISSPLLAANRPAQTPAGLPFVMLTEAPASGNKASQGRFLVRTLLMRDTGAVLTLRHRVKSDLLLELRAADQSPQDLQIVREYCGSSGLQVITDDVVTFSRDAIGMIGCGIEKLPPNEGDYSVAGHEQPSVAWQDVMGSTAETMKKVGSTSNDSVVISIESPGTLYQGEAGFFHIFADFEYEHGGGRLAEVDVYFMPGCNYSQSETINRWGMVSHGMICGTHGVPLGNHEGRGTARMGPLFDVATVNTEVWRVSS